MPDIFGGIEPPRWLQAIARPPERGELGGLLGTALAGGVKSLTEDKGFFDATQEARAAQADPMWMLKAKHLEVQSKALETSMGVKWLDSERKLQQLDWMQQSLEMTKDWTPKDPIPQGLDPKVTAALLGQKRQFETAENQRINNADSRDFISRNEKLPAELRATVNDVVQKEGRLSAKAYKALSDMELIESNRKATAVTIAETEAQLRGDQVRTTITGDKITETYTPPSTAGREWNTLEEKTVGGVTYVHVSPQQWRRKDDLTKPLTVGTLLTQYRWSLNNATDQVPALREFALKQFPDQAALFGVTNVPAKTLTPAKPSGSKPRVVSITPAP